MYFRIDKITQFKDGTEMRESSKRIIDVFEAVHKYEQSCTLHRKEVVKNSTYRIVTEHPDGLNDMDDHDILRRDTFTSKKMTIVLEFILFNM